MSTETPAQVMAAMGAESAELEAILALWASLIKHPLTPERAKIWNLRYGFPIVVFAIRETAAKALRREMNAEYAYAFCGRVMTTKLFGRVRDVSPAATNQ